MRYQDLIKVYQADWDAYTHHQFVAQIANGSLAQACFLHYLKQDFLFLKQYARAYALAIYKANTLADMRKALPNVHTLLDSEIAHHVCYCADWGLSEADLEAQEEDFGTVAYTRYVLDAGMSGDLIDLYTALVPCSIGYAEIGHLLANDKNTLKQGTPFSSWISLYSSEKFQKSAKYFNELLAEIDIKSQRGQHIIKVFKTATRMEIAFWQQGYSSPNT